MKKNGLNAEADASFSALLADAMARASRAARIERATRWGTRVLWGGGVVGGAGIWLFEQDASATGRNVAIVLFAALCVGVLGALKPKSKRKGRRSSALLAARRLEEISGRVGVFVAAVDFCEEESDVRREKSETSVSLRSATVAAASCGYAELAATLDEAELFAVLTETPVDRFRKIKKTRWICALGILTNLAVWEGSGGWEEYRGEKKARLTRANVEQADATFKIAKNELNKENKENKEKGEKAKDAANNGNGEDGGTQETEKNAALEALSLASMELLISELAQNAEIAASLKEELKGAVDAEDRTGAAAFLQLARELSANLARPESGLYAQTRRINAAAKRERQKIEARLAKNGRGNASERIDGMEKIEKIEEIDEKGEAQNERITGKEIAVFLTSTHLTELENKLTAAGGIGDVTTLELSRVLRSDSPTERKKILAEAAARVDEWETTLRREETAARILSESLRFDETSRQRTSLAERAWEENRALLARFAGRSNGAFEAPQANDEGLKEAKRRFDALWREIKTTEQEGTAIVDRLRERLQSEDAQWFVAFAKEGARGWETLNLDGCDADESAWRALGEMTSQNEERWTEIAQDVENNRFGIAAGRLEIAVEPINVDWTEIKERWLRVENKEVGEIFGARPAEELEEDGRRERRFSALAALLTLGVGEKTTREIAAQASEKEDVALSLIAERNAVSAENDLTSQEGEKPEVNKNGENEGSKLAQNGEKGEKNKTTNEINNEEIKPWSAPFNDDEGSGKSASAEEPGSENGATAIGGAGGGGTNDVAETSMSKAFNAELPPEARRRFEGTNAPEILPEYAEKIRLYRRRISEERR